MKFKSQEEVELIRKMYPEGTELELDYMNDFQAPPSGTKGKVTLVDSIGQIHVNWENGSSLALNTDIDRFHKI